MDRAIAERSLDWIRIMNGQLQAFATDRFEFPLPTDHRFPLAKYHLLRERLEASEFVDSINIAWPEAATDQQLQLVHVMHVIDSVLLPN
jgi:acetoin utilization deacetylase AcuC-like enzyme